MGKPKSLRIVPVILSGGSGTRLWPLSHSMQPKQFINLMGETSLFQETLERLRHIPDVTDPVVVCNEDHRFVVTEQMQEIGIHHGTIITEPVARNTAPAIAVAATYLESDGESEQSLMLVLPTDHLIHDIREFVSAVNVARNAENSGRLVLFGIRPDRPSTGYGYIKVVGRHANMDAIPVERFVEKPNRSAAESYLLADNYFWNSGMFLISSKVCLNELDQLSPTLRVQARNALDHAEKNSDFIRLESDRYAQCENISFDSAVVEHSDRVSMVPMEAGWSDIGSWSSLWDVGKKDEAGNVLYGNVCLENVKNSYVHSENNQVIVIGVDELVIAEAHNGLLVTSKNYDQDISRIVAQLQESQRFEAQRHGKEFRKWGYFVCLDRSHRFQVKRITVKHGESTSLQKHRYRSEHWVVVSGIAEVTCGDETFTLLENESTFIPADEKHRLRNIGQMPLEVIEVQFGSYLGEDDIQRF